MIIQNQTDLDGIHAAGHAVAVTLKKMKAYAKPGISTLELDEYGNSILQSLGALSAPKEEYDFPGYTCISVNDEVCHGIPSKSRILKEGDLVNVDVSAVLNDYFADNGGSFILGEDIQGLNPLVQASKEILQAAILQIRDRVKISDVGGFIHMEAKKRGFTVIKNLCGHGVGFSLHEKPSEIPCFRDRFNRTRFEKNSVIALETFISTRGEKVYELDDGWTMKAKEPSFVTQHEHTLIVTDDIPIIVTHENGIADF